jgi:hypothetical protein
MVSRFEGCMIKGVMHVNLMLYLWFFQGCYIYIQIMLYFGCESKKCYILVMVKSSNFSKRI